MEVTDHETRRPRTHDDHRHLDVWTGACLIGIVVVTVAWWSSYRNVIEFFIPVTSKRSIEVHQLSGRITLSFERYGGRPLFSPPGYRPTRPSFFQMRPLSPDAAQTGRPWFEYTTVGYAIVGVRSGKPSWPGYFWTIPHALLVILLAIYPMWQLGRLLPVLMKPKVNSDAITCSRRNLSGIDPAEQPGRRHAKLVREPRR